MGQNKLAIFALYLACFPYFGLDITDMSGFDRLEVGSLSNFLQIFIVGVSCLTLVLLWFKKNDRKAVSQLEKGALPIVPVLAFFAMGTTLSVLVNTPESLVSWFRTIQFVVTIFLSIAAIRTLLLDLSITDVGIIFLQVVRNVFLVALACLLIAVVISPNLALMNTEDRGVRLGGSFIHPNTLALGAVTFFVASYFLRLVKRLGMGAYIFSILASILVVLFTVSSSGALVIFAVVFLIFARRMGALLRLLGYVALLFGFAYSLVSVSAGSVQLWGTWSDRLVIWDQAFIGISENAFLGVGPYSGIRDYLSMSSLFSYFTPSHTHNLILDAFLTRGIIFSTPFLILVVFFIYKTFELSHQVVKPLQFGFTLLVFVIVLHGMVESSFCDQVKAFCHGTLVSAMFIYAIYMKEQVVLSRSKLANRLNYLGENSRVPLRCLRRYGISGDMRNVGERRWR